MFRFEEDGMYQMPVHFGPCCGPRRGPDGERLYKKGSQESTQHMLVYETDAKAVSRYLPEGFSVRMPYIIITHKMHRNLPWLAGHGYNVTTFNVPVTYCGTNDEIKGQYQLAIWENHADPIICGREQLGYSKIYADITDICEEEDGTYAALSSWNFKFLKLHFKMDEKPDDLSEMQKVLFDEENEGIMHYKYIPHAEAGFNKADVQYVTITPKTFPAPEDAKPLPQPERVWGNASLEWWIPEWKDMPTQYHIVQGLASLPILRVVGASKVHLWHYNDVYHQKAIE